MQRLLGTMMWTDDVAGRARYAQHCSFRPGCVHPDSLLGESPRRLDGIEQLPRPPVGRTAPTSVRLSLQFVGYASEYSWPRWTHARGRPIAIFSPVSSMVTNRFGLARPIPHAERRALEMSCRMVSAWR